MSTSLPSLITRRKKLPGYSGLNSAKVLADYTPNTKCPKSFYQETFKEKSKYDNHNKLAAGKVNRSDPNQVSFIYENPHFVNEPICFANALTTRNIQHKWWPDAIPIDKKPVPKFNTNTVNRSDFITIDDRPEGLTRFGCNTQRLTAAKGIIPCHGDVTPVIAKERISYEHQFDSRQGRKERGRLHGSFVWEPVVDDQLRNKIAERLSANKTFKY